MGGRARRHVVLALEGSAVRESGPIDIYTSSSDPIYSTSVDPARLWCFHGKWPRR